MRIRIGLLHRRPELTPETFRQHWLQVHGPIAADLPGLRAYEQNHVLERVPTDTVPGLPERYHALAKLDGIAKLSFDDEASMRQSFASPLVEAIRRDKGTFIGTLQLLTAESNVVVPPPAGAGAFKRISFLTRRPEMGADAFAAEWHGAHAELVRSLPGCRGYVQNRIEGRFLARGERATYEQMPYDGVAELWFDDPEAMRAAYTSGARDALRAHARTMIHEIATFVVDMHRIR